MQRPPPPQPPATEASPLPLSRLLEAARAPGAARPEVDALLRGLSLPLPAGEDARARADLLHDILQDQRVRAFTGSNGRRVAHEAVRALEALGYPYALEVPPELLAEARAAVPPPPPEQKQKVAVVESGASARPSFGRSGAQIVGGVLVAWSALGAGLFYTYNRLLVGPETGSTGTSVMVACYLLIALATAFLAPTEGVRRTRWLHWLLLVMTGLPGLLLAGRMLSALQVKDLFWLMFALVQLGFALMPTVGAALLYGRHPDRQALGEREG